MIKVIVLHVTRSDDGANTLAIASMRNTIYFIDGWRHAHDENDNRIDDLKVGDTCRIEEWYLSMRKKDYNNLPSI